MPARLSVVPPVPEAHDPELPRPGYEAGLIVVDLDRVHDSPDNPRTSLGDLNGLADSMLVAGLVQPIVVRDLGEGQYELVAGHRRVGAARLLTARGIEGWDSLSAIVREGRDAEATQADRLIENLQREDLDPVDEGAAYRKLIDAHGWTGAKVARAIGVNQGHISKRLALLGLVPTVVDRLRAGALRLSDAIELGGQEPPVQEAVTALLVEAPQTSYDAALRQARRELAIAAEHAETRAIMTELGVPEVTGAPQWWMRGAEGGPAVVDEHTPRDWGMTLDAHRELPCAAWQLAGYPRANEDAVPGKWAVPACTDPDSHARPEPEGDVAGEDDAAERERARVRAEREREAAAREALYAEASADAEARGAFIQELLRGRAVRGGPDYVLRMTLMDGLFSDVVAEDQLPTATVDRYQQAAEWLDREDVLDAMDAGRDGLARWAVALRLAMVEDRLAPIRGVPALLDRLPAPIVATHLRFLKAGGHKLSEREAAVVRDAPELGAWLFGAEDTDPEDSPAADGLPVLGVPGLIDRLGAREEEWSERLGDGPAPAIGR